MIRILFILFFIFQHFHLFSQKKNKISIEVNYGLNGNFFVVNPDYGTQTGPNSGVFYRKNFIGAIGGLDMKINTGEKSRLGIGYARSVNRKEIDFSGNFINAGIKDWHITHTDKFFQFYYERDFSKKLPLLKYQVGLLYLRMDQQEVDIGDFPNGGIGFEERNYKSNKLEEGGLFLGVQFSKKIDTKFELGIRSRVYYLISTVEFNNITLTPTLTYHF